VWAVVSIPASEIRELVGSAQTCNKESGDLSDHVLPLHSWQVSEVHKGQGQAVFSELPFISELPVFERSEWRLVCGGRRVEVRNSLHVVVDGAHRLLEGVPGALVDLEGVDRELVQILGEGKATDPAILQKMRES
jgi:hypothetical protein